MRHLRVTHKHMLNIHSFIISLESFSYLLLVVGNDAPDEVGVGVSERGHEFGQLLLIELPDRPEHSLTGLKRARQLGHPGHFIQTHDTVH